MSPNQEENNSTKNSCGKIRKTTIRTLRIFPLISKSALRDTHHLTPSSSTQSQQVKILITWLPTLPAIILFSICEPITHITHYLEWMNELLHNDYHPATYISGLLLFFLFWLWRWLNCEEAHSKKEDWNGRLAWLHGVLWDNPRSPLHWKGIRSPLIVQ